MFIYHLFQEALILVSCFVLGNLFQSVNVGEIQNKGLGMDVDIFDENGSSIKDLER